MPSGARRGGNGQTQGERTGGGHAHDRRASAQGRGEKDRGGGGRPGHRQGHPSGRGHVTARDGAGDVHDDNANITTTTYTHTITGGAFTGEMRLIKQGDGILKLPNVTETYTGNTDVWNGELDFDGNMASSRVWLNRFASLKTNGGKFGAGIVMDYASKLLPQGDVSARSVTLNFGSRIVMVSSLLIIKSINLRTDYKIMTSFFAYSFALLYLR